MSRDPVSGPATAVERPLRVLLTTDFFHPHIGGAERQVRLLAGALAGRGYDVRIATVWQPGLAEREVIDGIAVDRMRAVATSTPWFSGDSDRRFVPPAPDPALVIGLRRTIVHWRPDIVHASGWIAYASAMASVGRSASLVISVRDYGYACATRTLLQDDVRPCSGPAPAKCMRCAAHHYGALKGAAAVAGVAAGRPLLSRTVRGVHSVSRFVEAALKRDLARGPAWDDVRFERIPDVVESPDGAPLTVAATGLVARLPRQPFILFVGALQPHKGVTVLVEAYARLASPPPLVLIGTRWPDTPALPASVTVLSNVPHPVVMAAWGRSLFGVVPSVWEDPLPGVVREAMVSGRAVVASDVGGIPDMVTDGSNGLLVPPGDPGALAAAMRRLIDDPALAERLGEAGRGSVADLGADAIGARFEAFYRGILGNDAGDAPSFVRGVARGG